MCHPGRAGTRANLAVPEPPVARRADLFHLLQEIGHCQRPGYLVPEEELPQASLKLGFAQLVDLGEERDRFSPQILHACGGLH